MFKWLCIVLFLLILLGCKNKYERALIGAYELTVDSSTIAQNISVELNLNSNMTFQFKENENGICSCQ